MFPEFALSQPNTVWEWTTDHQCPGESVGPPYIAPYEDNLRINQCWTWRFTGCWFLMWKFWSIHLIIIIIIIKRNNACTRANHKNFTYQLNWEWLLRTLKDHTLSSSTYLYKPTYSITHRDWVLTWRLRIMYPVRFLHSPTRLLSMQQSRTVAHKQFIWIESKHVCK